MGKVRKARHTKQKKNVQPQEDSGEEENISDSKETAIQTLLDQIQCDNVEEKYCGLQTFSFLTENSENIDQIISRGVVKVAAPLLLDAASSVRNAASGALRNMSAIGLEVCDAMMEQDVMTPLTCYFHQFAETWIPDPSSKGKDEDLDTMVQAVNLLLNLSESSDIAIRYLGQSKILDIFPRYLDLTTFGGDVVTAVLQCLFVVLEDNPTAIEKVRTNSEKQLEQLIMIEDNDPLYLLIKTLAAGVIINTCEGNITKLPVNIISKIMSILATSLAVDHRLACNQLSSNVPLASSNGVAVPPVGKNGQVLEKQIKSVSQLLDAQQSSVEIIANILSNEGNEDSLNGENSSDGEEMADEDEIDGNVEESQLVEDKLPPEITEALVSLEVFEKVWARTQLPAENVMLILKEYDGTQILAKKLHNLQTRSLLCINNMLSSLPIENLGGVDGVYKVWVDAGKLAFKQNVDNVNLLESATAVMRAALDKMKGTNNGTGNIVFNELALSDIELMLTGIRECLVPEIRANLIRMIGLLALLLVNNLNEATSSVICTITEFILEQAHKENEVWVLAEAIDTIVDLYSEDETDVLAAKVKLVDKLAVIAPILRNKARQQKRLPKEYKVLVSTATTNLPRFIKYKKSRISKL